MGEHAEDNDDVGEDDDDVGDGGGANSASNSIARRFGSVSSSFANHVVAILHILGRNGAAASAGAGTVVGAAGYDGAGRVVFGCGGGCGGLVVCIGVALGCGGVAVGSGGHCMSGRGMNRLH